MSGPSGLTVGTDGLISWTPLETQASTTNTVTLRVFDNGAPSLSATNSFTVIVASATNVPPPLIESISVTNGTVTITWSTVAGYSYGLEGKDSVEATNWTTVSPPKSALGPTDSASEPLGDTSQRFYRVIRQP